MRNLKFHLHECWKLCSSHGGWKLCSMRCGASSHFPSKPKSSTVTFASKITIARICLVPVFAALAFYYGHTVKIGEPVETLRWWALGVYVTAASSDGIDGWVARRFNQCSKFGAFIDPIADKALLLTGAITLTFVDWGSPGWHLPLWFAPIVVARDCIILGGIRILSFGRWNVDRAREIIDDCIDKRLHALVLEG